LISPKRAFTELNYLLSVGATRVGVADFDWQTWRRHSPSALAPKFSSVIGITEEQTASGATSAFIQSLAVLEPAEQLRAMTDRITSLVARVIGVSGSKFDTGRPIEALGLDSLMVAEIGTMIEEELGTKISMMEEMNGTVAEMAQRVLAVINSDRESSVARPPDEGRRERVQQ
jgi:acyl carrier protein